MPKGGAGMNSASGSGAGPPWVVDGEGTGECSSQTREEAAWETSKEVNIMSLLQQLDEEDLVRDRMQERRPSIQPRLRRASLKRARLSHKRHSQNVLVDDQDADA